MKKIYAVLLLQLFSVLAFAQEIKYFSKNFQTREEKQTGNERRYYGSKDTVRVEDYVEKVLDLKGTVYGTEDLALADKFIYFVRNRGFEVHYQPAFEKLKGNFTLYRSSGKPLQEMAARGKKVLVAQYYDMQGQPVLTNGSGTYKNVSSDGKEEYQTVYTDSVMTSSITIRRTMNDTIFLVADRIASPVGGYDKFINDLKESFDYPTLAKLVGKEGLVYIRFVVDKDGSLTEFTPLTREGFSFEKKAIKKLSKLPKWNPALADGKPVKMYFTLPFRFRLQ